MHKTNIKNLDLGLLVALSALLEEKNVTRAAQRINLSQPATSRALARLREVFHDPLLVKGTKGMVLTTRAQELYQPLQNVLNDINAIIAPPSVTPATMQGELVIATRDYELTTILPQAIKRIITEAPHLTIKIVPLVGDEFSLLENQNVDFILTASESNAATLHRHSIFKESFVCLLAKDNPIAQKGMTLKDYMAARHCLITTSGFGLGVVDTLLAQKKLKRHIAIRVPHFLAARHVVSDSDLILTVPLRLGKLFSQQDKMILIEPPVKIPKFSIYLYWHTRNHNNPMHQWVRKIIQTSCGSK